MEQAEYVSRVLARYRDLPGSLQRVLRDDRHTAREIYRRNVPLSIVENAFTLVIARRARPPDAEPLDPIRTLRYILPVIDELLSHPPDPGYLRYLEVRLKAEGLTIPDSPTHDISHSAPPPDVTTNGSI